jgi:hypothetical protein
MRIGWREDQRRRAIEAILSGAQNDGLDVSCLAGVAIKYRSLATVDQIGM